MKGTAILYQEDNKIRFVENIEEKTFNEIKKQCNCDHCNCHVEKNRLVDFGKVSMVEWKADDLDWEYGY